MTEFNKDYLDSDPKWNEKEEAVEGGSKTRFAKIRLFYPLHVNRFTTGEHFTLPDVFYDEYDEDAKVSTRIGPKEFRGMTLAKSGKFHMALVVLEMQNKDGQWYQRQTQFSNWKDKDATGCAWLDLQKAEMEKLAVIDRNALVQTGKDNSWVFVQYNEADTGYEGQYEIKKYLTDIVVFENEKKWQEAQANFQAQFSDNNVDPTNSLYPARWYKETTPDEMIAYARTIELDYNDNESLAEQLQLTDNGKIALTQDGKEVDVEAIIAEVRDIPEEMANPLAEDTIPY